MVILGNIRGTDIYRNLYHYKEAQRIPGFLILSVEAPINFANTNYLNERYTQVLDSCLVYILNAYRLGLQVLTKKKNDCEVLSSCKNFNPSSRVFPAELKDGLKKKIMMKLKLQAFSMLS
jgi:STAS domain